jgi:hypothetical protein
MGPFFLGAEAKLTLHTSVKMMSNNNNNNNSFLFSISLSKAAKVMRPSDSAQPLRFVPLEGEGVIEAIHRLNRWGYLMK